MNTCPKCKAPHIEGAEYCICGHKWDDTMDMFEQLFKGFKDEPTTRNKQAKD